MKKLNYLFIIPLLVMTSCSDANFKTITPGRTYEIKNSVILSKAKIFDYQVDMTKRVEGKAEGKLKTMQTTLEYFKEQALADANIKAGCDFLINPIYTIEQQGMYVKVAVIGYAGKYTSERDLEAKDSIHLQINGIHIQPNVSPVNNQPSATPKRVIGIF